MKSKRFILLFTIGICIALTDFNLTEASRSSFGESCSRTQKCDRRAWLSCYEGNCNCSKPEEMLYDQEKEKCVTKSGERCKYGVEESGESSLVEITECIQHSNCGSDGICNCDFQYHEIFNDTCAKSKSFGENCTDEDKCSKFEQLDCVEGTCQCREGDSVYSLDETQCVGMLNKVCVINKCENNTECKNGKCVCDEDHYEDSGRCVPRKGALENCTKDSECIHKGLFVLKCFNNVCNCQVGTVLAKVQKTKYFPQHERIWYGGRGNHHYKFEMDGPFTNLCAPLVGMNCMDGYCVPNAYCYVPADKRLDDKLSYGNCACFQSYLVNDDKTKCGKRHQDSCTKSEECFNGFVCLDGKCQCASHFSQMPMGTYCATKYGGECSNEAPCIENAFCEFLPDSGNKVGHCRCNEGYVRNKEGTCDIGFGQNCSYSRDKFPHNCDKAAGLTCVNEKCSCSDKMFVYSNPLRKCLRKVGAVCDEKESCVENAVCYSDHPDLPSICACQSGFKETLNLTCVE